MIKPYESSGLAGPTVLRAAPPFASTPGSGCDLVLELKILPVAGCHWFESRFFVLVPSLNFPMWQL